MITYLTHLLGRKVVEPDGRRAGRVVDVIASQGGRLPTVTAYFVKGDREGWIDAADTEVGEKEVRLRRSWSGISEYEPGPNDLRLQRDILDKQIVDVHDCRVVRVTDVRLAPCGEDRFCVVGADTSFRALARRIGIGKPLESVASMIHRPLRSKLIAWDDLQAFEPGSAGGGRIKLNVPHAKIAHLHPAEIADIVEQLGPQQRAEVIQSLDVEKAADIIEEMEDEEAAAIMSTLHEEMAADILEEMDPDEAANVLGDLSEARSEELLEHMEPEEAAEVKELLAYDEETAGGLMTPEFIAIKEDLTTGQTIKRLRELSPKAETIYYVYVVDTDDRLAGVLSLRDLIVASPKTPIGDVMVRNVRFAHTHDHADDVAQTITRYNLLALPVVDDEHVLQGIITVDDMMERLVPPERRRKLPQLLVDDD